MSKATPGPWQVGGGFMAEHHERYVIRGAQGQYIGRVNYGAGDRDCVDGNATLIAAAPDLRDALILTHEALDTLLAEVEGQCGTYGCMRDAGYEALKLAKAALEKARLKA